MFKSTSHKTDFESKSIDIKEDKIIFLTTDGRVLLSDTSSIHDLCINQLDLSRFSKVKLSATQRLLIFSNEQEGELVIYSLKNRQIIQSISPFAPHFGQSLFTGFADDDNNDVIIYALSGSWVLNTLIIDVNEKITERNRLSNSMGNFTALNLYKLNAKLILAFTYFSNGESYDTLKVFELSPLFHPIKLICADENYDFIIGKDFKTNSILFYRTNEEVCETNDDDDSGNSCMPKDIYGFQGLCFLNNSGELIHKKPFNIEGRHNCIVSDAQFIYAISHEFSILKLSDNSIVEKMSIIDYSVAQDKIIILESPNRYRIIALNMDVPI